MDNDRRYNFPERRHWPMDKKRFESEICYVDAAVSEEKSREKFETRTEKAVNDLRNDMNLRF
jgi:hypothetical protein